MQNNNGESNRLALVIDIQLTTGDSDTTYVLKSRNISDTGIFLEFDENYVPLTIGTPVILQVCSIMNDEPPAPINAEVVHVTDEGMGLSFIL